MAYDFEQAMDFIHDCEKQGSILGTQRIAKLLAKLKNPQDDLKIIHIAGTNGKGSTLAMISAILIEAGYRVGRYISPTLITYLERIQVNGRYITANEFASVMEDVERAANGMEMPTAFEAETAAALCYFKSMDVDFVLLETGLGGRDDATNVCTPICSVITPIGYDHMGILGNTLEEIASNKAGIIKNDSIVVTASQTSEAMTVIERKCKFTRSELICSDARNVKNITYGDILKTECDYPLSYEHPKYGEIEVSLAGTWQVENSCTAISCIEVLNDLGYNITEKNIKNGLKHTIWFGRFSRVGLTPPCFLDGAHNIHAANVLADTIRAYFSAGRLGGRKLVYIMGVFEDKDYNGIIRSLVPMADKVFTVTTPDNPRAMDCFKLAQVINDSYHDKARPCRMFLEAVVNAASYNDGNVVIIGFGSLSHLIYIREAYNEWIRIK